MIGNFGGMSLAISSLGEYNDGVLEGVRTIYPISYKEEKIMKTFAIQLKEINDVYTLVNTLVAYDGAVDLGSGRYVVDGRSILGIFSLDLRQPVNVHVHRDEDVEKLKSLLGDFLVA